MVSHIDYVQWEHLGGFMDSLIDKAVKNGVRMTQQRKIIISVFEKSDDHPDVDTLYRRANNIDSSISLATVYRTVGILEGANVIDKLDIGDGKARYEASGEHHEHLVDIDTNEIHEFHHAELEALKVKIARDMGYELVHHRLELYGRKIT